MYNAKGFLSYLLVPLSPSSWPTAVLPALWMLLPGLGNVENRSQLSAKKIVMEMVMAHENLKKGSYQVASLSKSPFYE